MPTSASASGDWKSRIFDTLLYIRGPKTGEIMKTKDVNYYKNRGTYYLNPVSYNKPIDSY
jgi:hypothetical protein